MTSKQENYAKAPNAITAGLVFADEKYEDDFLVLVYENIQLDFTLVLNFKGVSRLWFYVNHLA